MDLVRELRQQEWIDRLPEAERKDLLLMTAPMRANRVALLREQERKQRQEWADWANGVQARLSAGPRPTKPARLAEFPESVQTFVKERLTPALSEEEAKRLAKAEGEWPRLAKTILDLSEKHPVLPPKQTGPIERFNQLPKEAKEYLVSKKKVQEELHKSAGKWPQYALAITEMLKQEKHTPPPLGASRPAEFSDDIQAFLKGKLEPALTADEKTKLHAVEGRWPDYPQRLVELSAKYKLIAPGMSLPGPPELWNSARGALPAVSDRTLEDFHRYELTEEDRARIRAADPEEQLEILKEAYFKKYPEELSKLRRLDKRGAAIGKP